MPGGRPTKYNIELSNKICEEIANGKSFNELCRQKDMPARSTVMKWLHEKKEFSDRYAKARRELLEHWADEIVDISDDGTNDYMINKHGAKVFNKEHSNRSRLRVDTRKWLMSKLAPQKYSDSLKLDGKMELTNIADIIKAANKAAKDDE